MILQCTHNDFSANAERYHSASAEREVGRLDRNMQVC